MIGKYFLNAKRYVRLELYQINLKEVFKRSQKVQYCAFHPSILLKAEQYSKKKKKLKLRMVSETLNRLL